MTNESKRFLALNALLHGHDILDVFSGSITEMAECLSIDESKASNLIEGLDSIKACNLDEHPLTMVFLNYYRNNHYTFVSFGKNIINMSQFVNSDLSGNVSDELRYGYLTNLVKDIDLKDHYAVPTIKDGVLRCTAEDFNIVHDCMIRAYTIYLLGPGDSSKKLIKDLRKYTSLDNYSGMSGATLVKIIEQIIKTKLNPTVYQQTVVNTSDLMSIYEKTGCIMCLHSKNKSSLCWLLDVEGQEDSSTVVTVDCSHLRKYMSKGLRDLQKVKAVVQSNGVGKLYPEVL